MCFLLLRFVRYVHEESDIHLAHGFFFNHNVSHKRIVQVRYIEAERGNCSRGYRHRLFAVLRVRIAALLYQSKPQSNLFRSEVFDGVGHGFRRAAASGIRVIISRSEEVRADSHRILRVSRRSALKVVDIASFVRAVAV